MLAILAIALAAWSREALAQTADSQPPASSHARGSRGREVALFLTGAAAGLGAHESGHLIFGAALGGHPRLVRLDYGPFPFFAVHHDEVSRHREFAISSSGFWMQHAGSEWLLTTRPRLKSERAPFAKGLLAFNLGTSVVYSLSAFGRFGPPERDPRSIAMSMGEHGVGEPVVGLLILAPAALDFYRYERPDSRWAKWLSRGVKAGLVLLIVK
jgi:hypothetical protein